MSEFYVYAHLREDNTPRYIGKGKGDRAYSKGEVHPPNERARVIFVETRVKCSHCEIEGVTNLMKRWHFDNCKQKVGK